MKYNIVYPTIPLYMLPCLYIIAYFLGELFRVQYYFPLDTTGYTLISKYMLLYSFLFPFIFITPHTFINLFQEPYLIKQKLSFAFMVFFTHSLLFWGILNSEYHSSAMNDALSTHTIGEYSLGIVFTMTILSIFAYWFSYFVGHCAFLFLDLFYWMEQIVDEKLLPSDKEAGDIKQDTINEIGHYENEILSPSNYHNYHIPVDNLSNTKQ